MYRFFLAVLVGISYFGNAQKLDDNLFKKMNIRNIGPAGMSGRVTAIDVVLKDPKTMYIGTASGGVWKSTSEGLKWEPVFEKESTQSIGSIAINQRNSDEIWAGTGEGNPRNSMNCGDGIYKSLDAGKTWKNMGLKETKTIHRVIIHRDNPEVVFAASLGSAWGPTEERGVFKTTDGGKTWKKVLFVNNLTGCAELVVDQNNPNKLIAAMWEYQRKPWNMNSGGKGSGIYVSYDAGENWTKRTEEDGMPKGELGRVGLAISKSKPNVVYALIEAKENALYRSDDGGLKWRKLADKNMGDRPFYYAEIYVDPKNENRVYSIHTNITKSEDGGKNFETWAGWAIHPDHHAFWISPDDTDFIINGNDGGVNITKDGGKTWRFVENLPVGQFYHVNVDNEIPYNVYGGLQDNGSWVGPSNVWRAGGIMNQDWKEVLFGDGFDVMPRKDNTRYGYAMSQGGELNLFDKKSGVTENLKPVHPEGKELRYNWNSALAQNPFHDKGIYYCSQYVHKSMDCGKSWEIISPDLSTADSIKLKKETGGLTPDITGAENHCTIIAIAPSPVDEMVLWAGTDDGNVQVTTDGGKIWTNTSAAMPGCPKNAWIPQIEVSVRNAGEAFVVVNHYRFNDWRPYLYHTKDFGKSWERLADEKQVDGFCLSVVQDPAVENLLFLGTDKGLYMSMDAGKTWTKWKEFPSVPIYDMKIHPRENDLVLATFGRSLWIMDNISPLREIAGTNAEVFKKPFAVFKPAKAYQADWRSYEGVRFGADAYFRGASKSTAADFLVWVKKSDKVEDKSAKGYILKSGNSELKIMKSDSTQVSKGADKMMKGDTTKLGKKDDKKDDKKKVTMHIIDWNNDTIRTTKSEIDTGFTHVYWRLERKGVRMPNRNEPKPDADEPWGISALPGTYKVMMIYGEFKDSTTVQVLPDPNDETLPAVTKKRYDGALAFYKNVEKLTAALDKMREMEKTIKLISEQWVNVPDSVKKEAIKSGDALKDSIAAYKKMIVGTEGGKGIQRDPNTINGAIWNALGYISADDGAKNTNATYAAKTAVRRIDEMVEKVNGLINKDWPKYKELAEKVPYSLFKSIESIKN